MGLKTILKRHNEVIMRFIGMLGFWVKNYFEEALQSGYEIYKNKGFWVKDNFG